MIKLDIEGLLKQQDKKKYWLLQKTGLSYAVINRMIRGEYHCIYFHTIELLCDALGCEPGDLIKREK